VVGVLLIMQAIYFALYFILSLAGIIPPIWPSLITNQEKF
jgi:hypothetical protein